jgi:hypothetical protein
MAISDIMVSPAKVFYGVLNSALPADNLALGANWPTGWTHVGYTKTALSVDYSYEKLSYEIQESIGNVGGRKTKEALSLETTLAEFTLAGVAQAWGGTVATTPAGAGQVGKEEITGGDVTKLSYQMWGFEGSYEDANQVIRPIRFFIYRGQSEAGGKLEFGKTDTTGIPLKIEALEDLTKAVGARLFKFQRILADATS